jgi:hypothetical protein
LKYLVAVADTLSMDVEGGAFLACLSVRVVFGAIGGQESVKLRRVDDSSSIVLQTLRSII